MVCGAVMLKSFKRTSGSGFCLNISDSENRRFQFLKNQKPKNHRFQLFRKKRYRTCDSCERTRGCITGYLICRDFCEPWLESVRNQLFDFLRPVVMNP